MRDASNSSSGLQMPQKIERSVATSISALPRMPSRSVFRQGSKCIARRREIFPVKSRRRHFVMHVGSRKRGLPCKRRGEETSSGNLKPTSKGQCETASKAHCELPLHEFCKQPPKKQREPKDIDIRNEDCPPKDDPPRQSSIEFSRLTNGMTQVMVEMGDSMRRSAGIYLTEKKRKRLVENLRARGGSVPTKKKQNKHPFMSKRNGESTSSLTEKQGQLTDSKAGSTGSISLPEKMSENYLKPRSSEEAKPRRSSKKYSSSKCSSSSKKHSSSRHVSSTKQLTSSKKGSRKKSTDSSCPVVGKKSKSPSKRKDEVKQKQPWTGLTYCDGRPFNPGEVDPCAMCTNTLSRTEVEKEFNKATTKPDASKCDHQRLAEPDTFCDGRQFVLEENDPSAVSLPNSKMGLGREQQKAKAKLDSGTNKRLEQSFRNLCDGQPFVPREFDRSAVCNGPTRTNELTGKPQKGAPKEKQKPHYKEQSREPKPFNYCYGKAVVPERFELSAVCVGDKESKTKHKREPKKNPSKEPSKVQQSCGDEHRTTSQPTTYCDGKPFLPGQLDAFVHSDMGTNEAERTSKAKSSSDGTPIGKIASGSKLQTYCDGKPFVPGAIDSSAVCTSIGTKESVLTKKPTDSRGPSKSKAQNAVTPIVKSLSSPRPVTYCDGKPLVPGECDSSAACTSIGVRESALTKKQTDSKHPLKSKAKNAVTPDVKSPSSLKPVTHYDGKPFVPQDFDPSAVCTGASAKELDVTKKQVAGPKETSNLITPDSVTSDGKSASGPQPLTYCDGKPNVPDELDPSATCSSKDKSSKKKEQKLFPKSQPVSYRDGKQFLPEEMDPSALYTSKKNQGYHNDSKTNLRNETRVKDVDKRCREQGTRGIKSTHHNTVTRKSPNESHAVGVKRGTDKNVVLKLSATEKDTSTIAKSTSDKRAVAKPKSSAENRPRSKKKATITGKNSKISRRKLRQLEKSPKLLYQKRGTLIPTGISKSETRRLELPNRRRVVNVPKPKESCRPQEPMPKSLIQSTRNQKEKQAAEAAREKCELLKEKRLQRVIKKKKRFAVKGKAEGKDNTVCLKAEGEAPQKNEKTLVQINDKKKKSEIKC